mgnify:CR=1 FL=1
MSTEVSIIFPNQLYKQHPAIVANRPVYLLEEWHFFNQYQFHKEKLVLHRASMKFYEQFLKNYYYGKLTKQQIECNRYR